RGSSAARPACRRPEHSRRRWRPTVPAPGRTTGRRPRRAEGWQGRSSSVLRRGRCGPAGELATPSAPDQLLFGGIGGTGRRPVLAIALAVLVRFGLADPLDGNHLLALGGSENAHPLGGTAG